MSRAKNWCLTWNNYDEVSMQKCFDDLICAYLVFGREISESGTEHIQGYVSFLERKTLSQVRQLIPTAHWEVMRGTPTQASQYCKKEKNFLEKGEMPLAQTEKGHSASLEQWTRIHELAKTGDKDKFLNEFPMHSFLHMNKFVDLTTSYRKKPKPNDVIENHWYLGKSGSGKSRTARMRYPDAYIKPTETKWWPDYNGEETVIIDDVGQNMEYVLEKLKIWGDHYPFQAEGKGTHTGLIRPKRLIVTSQYHWDEITLDVQLREALARRFKLTKFGNALGEVNWRNEISAASRAESEPAAGSTIQNVIDLTEETVNTSTQTQMTQTFDWSQYAQGLDDLIDDL